ncbi:hypothetical protein E4U43_005509, partial [Claviceps pusilla]
PISGPDEAKLLPPPVDRLPPKLQAQGSRLQKPETKDQVWAAINQVSQQQRPLTTLRQDAPRILLSLVLQVQKRQYALLADNSLLLDKNGDFPNNIQQIRCAKSRPTRFNWQRPSESRLAATLPPALVDAWEAG